MTEKQEQEMKKVLAEHGQEVAIIFDEKIVGLWNFPITIPIVGDYLAGIRELVSDEKYELTFRLRYFKDDKVFESKDEKHWYQGTLSGTRNFVVGSFREAVKMLAAMQQAEEQITEVLNEKRDLRDFMKRVERLPFMYLRRG
jgi:hypothetical protein